MKNIFIDGTREQKLAILAFLKEQNIINVSFACKNTVINFLQNRGIAHEEIFKDESLTFLGRISKISEDGTACILSTSGKEANLPIEYLDNVSLG
jgi:hypothetical protein